MANQSDRRDGHNFNSGSAMQQPTTQATKVGAGKNKTNPQYKGDKSNDKSGKSGKDGCC